MRKTANKVKNLFVKKPDLLVTDPAYHLRSLRHAPDMADLIWEIKRALEKGVEPEPYLQGSCATFFLRDCQYHPVAVFKIDHFLREVAAYRLDHQGFAGVPQTVLTVLEHPLWGGKALGSCQYFVPKTVAVVQSKPDEIERFSAASIRRIATLDIRLLNDDRHTSNILVAEDKRSLIPVDHAFILPSQASDVYYDWLKWDQAKTPFNNHELAYISLLDPEKDRTLLLEDFGFEERRVNRLFIATILLKMGALRGMTSADLGHFVSRKHINLLRREPLCSRFEILVEKIKERNATNWTLFSRIVYEEVERTLEDYEKTAREHANATANR